MRSLAQANATMFERNIAYLAVQRLAVLVATKSGDDHEGYLAGLDDEFLQIFQKGKGNMLIARDDVSSIKPTGDRLYGSTIDPDIARNTDGFVRTSESHLQALRKERDSD